MHPFPWLTFEAQLLQARGVQVATKVLVGGGIPRAIDEGVTEQVVMEDQSPANCRAHPDVR